MNQNWDDESLEWSDDEDAIEEAEENISVDSTEKRDRSTGKTTRFKKFLRKVSVMDIIIAFTAVIIIIAAVILGITLKNRADIKRAEQQELNEITDMYGKDTHISVVFTSYCKDLKIKFTDKNTGNLITKVDFDVDLITPSGEELVWKDEDEDGIIYQKDLAPGNYQVSIVSKNMFKYSTTAQQITVKDEYDYAKVDILNETLFASDVDSGKEDIGINDIIGDAPSNMSDTVDFVESTVVEIPYERTDRSNAVNPDTKLNLTIASADDKQDTITVAGNMTYHDLSGTSNEASVFNSDFPTHSSVMTLPDGVTVEKVELQEQIEMKVHDIKRLKAVVILSNGMTDEDGVVWTVVSGNVSIDSNGYVEANSAGTAIIKATAVNSDPADEKYGKCIITIVEETSEATPTAVDVVISNPDGNSDLKVGANIQLKGKVNYSDGTSNEKVKWSIEAQPSNCARVDNNNKLVCLSKGSVTITAKASDDENIRRSMTLKIVENVSGATKITISPDKATLNWKAPMDTASQYITLKADVTLQNGTDNSVVWTSSDNKIATIDKKGTVTAVGSGTVTITATTNAPSANDSSKKLTATAKITVNGFTMQINRTNERILRGTSFTITPTMTNYPTGNINWSSSNQSIVTVSNGVVTGVGNGNAVITATSVDKDINGNNVVLNCNVTVVQNPQNDTSSPLLTKSGKQLFVKNGSGEYTKATYADYYKNNVEFYVSTNGKCEYTGWQVIDNKTYFYDKNKKAVTGSQVIQGMKYNFDSNGVLENVFCFGTDLSSEDTSIDWDWLLSQGVRFVMIRCGYRGVDSNEIILDSSCNDLIAAAQEAGMNVGLYFESRATDINQAIDEASAAVAIAENNSLYNCRIAIAPLESNGNGTVMTSEERTDICDAFSRTIINCNYMPGVFLHSNHKTNYVNLTSLNLDFVWISEFAPELNFESDKVIWQQGVVTEEGKSYRRNIWFASDFDYGE